MLHYHCMLHYKIFISTVDNIVRFLMGKSEEISIFPRNLLENDTNKYTFTHNFANKGNGNGSNNSFHLNNATQTFVRFNEN